ncbi:MAG: metallophosphoesterase [Candidatus Kariarchaeaceae archaeon]
MRLLALADTHLGFKFGRTPFARKESFESMFISFQRVLDVAIKSKVDFVLHAGDIFNRSKPPKYEDCLKPCYHTFTINFIL